jgi:transposase
MQFALQQNEAAKFACPGEDRQSVIGPMPGRHDRDQCPCRDRQQIANQVGFVVLPRRWVVERIFAWINRNRRLVKDVEASIKSAAAFLYAAAAMLMIRRLARLS